MAGHSHWAGIKHKKGKADKIRSRIFSKLSREITVAAKLGDKNPEMNPRLRAAIQSAHHASTGRAPLLLVADAVGAAELMKYRVRLHFSRNSKGQEGARGRV